MIVAYMVVSILLIYTAGSWAYVFSQAYVTGALEIVEPNGAWLLAEFALATTFALVGLLAVIHSICKLR